MIEVTRDYWTPGLGKTVIRRGVYQADAPMLHGMGERLVSLRRAKWLDVEMEVVLDPTLKPPRHVQRRKRS